ncbi:MAG: hypothetical protein NTY55_02995 [Flavobacteriia bacterium]|nr:hypothetical protein [Flavobacteriia bacterium]
MLNNLTNFYNIIKGRMLRTSTTLKGTDIIPLGVVNPNYDGGYLPSAITVADLTLAVQPDTPTLQEVLDNNHDLVAENNFQGTGAGTGVVDAGGSNVNAFGQEAASTNAAVTNVNAFGMSAAYNNQAINVNAFGFKAAVNNTKSDVNAIGYLAASENEGGEVNAIGIEAAFGNKGNYVNALGSYAAKGNEGIEVIAIGTNAGSSNQLDGQFIISGSSLPVFADNAAATTAISLATNASAGSVYLYYNTALGAISAVFPA